MNDAIPRFPGERIRRDIEANILSGAWPPGYRIPFEHVLMQEYGCSRMTVSKAISALATAGADEATIPGLRRGTKLLRVVCRHWIADRPTALEDRLICLPQAPAAAEESFADIPPGTWLLRSVPWSEAEHVIGAHGADASTAALLDMDEGGACLALHRRTWHAGRLVTAVTLTYPGDRHRFVGRFSPGGG
jgi:GntR family histidine utilization transcriptional repressor